MARSNPLIIDPSYESDAVKRRWWQEVRNSLAEVKRTLGTGSPTGNDPVIGVTDHGELTGLGDDDHTQYLLLAGRTAGQIINGAADSSAYLTLKAYNGAPSRLDLTTGTLQFHLPGLFTSYLQVTNDTNSVLVGMTTSSLYLPTFTQSVPFISSIGYPLEIQALTGSPVVIGSPLGGISGVPSVALISGISSGRPCVAWGTSNGGGSISYLGAISDTGFLSLRTASNTPINSAYLSMGASTVAGSVNPIMVIRKPGPNAGSQTGDLSQWMDHTGTVVTKVDKDGNITAPTITATTGFSGPISLTTLTTRGDLLTRDASAQVRVAIGSAGKFLRTDGTDPSWQAILETDITNGSLYARLADSETIAGTWTFDNFNTAATLVLAADYSASGIPLVFFDSTSGNNLFVSLDAPVAADTTLFFPSTGGLVVSTLATQTLGSKTMAVDTILRVTNSGVGTRFQDTTVSSKLLRFVLSSSTGANVFTVLGNTRTYTFPDYTLTVGGKIASIDSGSKTTAIGTTNIIATPGAGLYEISGYLEITTAGGADRTVDVTIGWTDEVGARTLTLNNANGLPLTAAAPLSGAATNYAEFSYIVRLASGSPTYATSVAGAVGAAPTYRLFVSAQPI